MEVFEFLSAVRGNQYYTPFWNSQKDQMLECFHKNQTMFNQFAIKVCYAGKENPVDHLP